MMFDIDFVLTYLDPNDIEWQKLRNQYKKGENIDINPNRYRDWDNLEYFFKGIYKYAPWVRKIHVISCGQIPDFLNTDDPKINIINHKDYIPGEWLPTFSSRCIDMNFHRIPDLAEHFVYFNDDMFLTSEVSPEDFFHNGLPCDSAIISPQAFKMTYGINSMYLAPLVDIAIINKHFKKNNVIRNNLFKWINLKYGKELIRTLEMLVYPNFIGLKMQHLPYSYLKSTYEEVWKVEPELLSTTSSHKFREPLDSNHWIFSYWQLVTGKFYPRSTAFGRCFQLHSIEEARLAAKMIREKKYKVMCLNDAVQDENQFEEIKNCVNSALSDSIEG